MEVVGGEDADRELHRAAVVGGRRLATRRRRGGVVDDVVGQQQVARTWPQAVTIRHLAAGHVDAAVHHAVKAQTALTFLLLPLLQLLLHVRPRLAVNLAQRQSVAEFGIDGGPCPSAEDYPEPDSTCFFTRATHAMRKRGLCCRKTSVWLAGCLSHAGIVPKRLNLCLKLSRPSGSPIIPVFSDPLRRYPIPREPRQWRCKIHGVGKLAIFDLNRRLSLKRCEIGRWTVERL